MLPANKVIYLIAGAEKTLAAVHCGLRPRCGTADMIFGGSQL